MTHDLRENEDGTVSVLAANGSELIRGQAPDGARGIEGIGRMYHQKMGVVLRCLCNNAKFLRRAAHLDSFNAQPSDDERGVVVSVTWRNNGAWSKVYELRDLPPACRMRRLILGDILEARGA